MLNNIERCNSASSKLHNSLKEKGGVEGYTMSDKHGGGHFFYLKVNKSTSTEPDTDACAEPEGDTISPLYEQGFYNVSLAFPRDLIMPEYGELDIVELYFFKVHPLYKDEIHRCTLADLPDTLQELKDFTNY